MSSAARKRGYKKQMGCVISLSKADSIDINKDTANPMAYEVLEVGLGLRGKTKTKMGIERGLSARAELDLVH